MRARGVIVGVVVLGALLVGADRVAASLAERRVVSAIEANLQVTGAPRVHVGGFPFLTQAFAGSIDHVMAHADAMTVSGVEVTDVDVDAHGVATSQPTTVRRVVLTGTIPPATLTAIAARRSHLALDLRVDGDAIVASTAVLGLPVVARLTPRIEAGAIRVDATTVRVGTLDVSVDQLPGTLAADLRGLTIPVDGLPAGVTLTRVTIVPGGARITASGADVVLRTAD